MPSPIVEPDLPVLDESRLSDLAPIFNLVQAGSLNGNFSNLYTQPRYMAGLGVQLFSLWIGGRIRLPDGIWHRAEMRVLRVRGDFAGFVILRHDAGQPNDVEIYMCGVDNDFRGRGLGERMLLTAIAELPSGSNLAADCLPNSVSMQCLLRKIGFTDAVQCDPLDERKMTRRFVYIRR